MILTLDFASSVPIYQQIRNGIVKGIADGTYREGARLPAVRALAQEAGINAMTVNKAYQLLKQEGYIVTDRRNGATVRCLRQENEPGFLKLQEDLKLLVAEAKVNRVTEEELVELVREYYRRSRMDKSEQPNSSKASVTFSEEAVLGS